MAEASLLDSFGIGSIDIGAIINKAYVFVGVLFLAALIGGVLALGYFTWRKNKAQKDQKKIGWWEEVNGKLEPGKMENVEEIVIPGTTLRVFYGKKRDIWLPRFTRGITKDLFYVAKTQAGQMVNFTLDGLSTDYKTAGIERDDTDMLWAAENTREFIKRNYKDKSVKWWQLYRDMISTIVHIMVHTFTIVIIIYFLRGLVQDISGVVAQLKGAVQASCSSGLVAGGLMIKLKRRPE